MTAESTTITRSTVVYVMPLSDITPGGMVQDQDLAVISDLALFASDGRGFFTRGDQCINFEVGEDTLTVGYSQRGKRMAR